MTSPRRITQARADVAWNKNFCDILREGIVWETTAILKWFILKEISIRRYPRSFETCSNNTLKAKYMYVPHYGIFKLLTILVDTRNIWLYIKNVSLNHITVAWTWHVTYWQFFVFSAKNSVAKNTEYLSTYLALRQYHLSLNMVWKLPKISDNGYKELEQTTRHSQTEAANIAFWNINSDQQWLVWTVRPRYIKYWKNVNKM